MGALSALETFFLLENEDEAYRKFLDRAKKVQFV
jgi:hypothetical protein